MARSRIVVFPYGLVAGQWSPIISAGLHLGQIWRPVELYVDSGAAYAVVRAQVAKDADFDYSRGKKVLIQVGDGSMIPVFLHNLPIQIGSAKFIAPIGFSARLGVPFNLLGRHGVFEHFKICFHEKRKVVSFEMPD